MQDFTPFQKVLAHGFLALIACLPGVPILPFLYLGGVIIYYTGEWISDILKTGPSRPGFYAARRFVISLVLGVITAGWTAFGTDEKQPVEVFLVIVLPISLALFTTLYLWTLPFRLFRWKARRSQEHDSIQRSAAQARQEQQVALQQRESTTRDRNAQRRRDEVRSKCELLFALHAADIGQRFSKSMLDDFIDSYMSDQHDPDDVERRGRELQEIIKQHKANVSPAKKKPRTIQELSEWYLAEKARVEELPLDEAVKQDHLVSLDVRYSELTQDLLQKMEP